MSEPTPSTHYRQLERMMDEFLQQRRLGREPDADEYAARHPALASKFREMLPAALELEAMHAKPLAPTNPPQPQSSPLLPRLPDLRIIREIGRGGMGVVYLAEQMSLNRHVAVKTVQLDTFTHPKALKRFRREARSAAKLHHTNIVPVFFAGRKRNCCYYVMQLIEGMSLDEVLRCMDGQRNGPASQSEPTLVLPRIPEPADEAPAVDKPERPACSEDALTQQFRSPRAVATIIVQIAYAIQHAHDQGILHRDIKPGNVIVDKRGVAWITDFGLAKPLSGDSLSQSGHIAGTLRYMAPECLDGRAEKRSDVYSLGMTLCELLSCRTAFDMSSQAPKYDLIRRIRAGETIPLATWRPDLPEDLQVIVHKAIDPAPHKRYQSARQLADDLQRFLDGKPVYARRRNSNEPNSWAKRSLDALTSVITVAHTRLQAVVARLQGFLSETSAQRLFGAAKRDS